MEKKTKKGKGGTVVEDVIREGEDDVEDDVEDAKVEEKASPTKEDDCPFEPDPPKEEVAEEKVEEKTTRKRERKQKAPVAEKVGCPHDYAYGIDNNEYDDVLSTLFSKYDKLITEEFKALNEKGEDNYIDTSGSKIEQLEGAIADIVKEASFIGALTFVNPKRKTDMKIRFIVPLLLSVLATIFSITFSGIVESISVPI